MTVLLAGCSGGTGTNSTPPASSPKPPTANAGGPYSALTQIPFSLSASGSSDPQGETLTYMWNFGDGTTATGVAPTHTYATVGSYSVVLTVADTSNLSAVATTTATVSLQPNATVNINTAKPLAVPSRSSFSGANMQLFNVGTSYLDPNMQALAASMNLGWVRFPGGTVDDVYDWATGDMPDAWINQFSTYSSYSTLQKDATIIRGKGLIHLTDLASFLATQSTGPANSAGSSTTHVIGVINTFTDTPQSAASLVSTAAAAGIHVDVWELGNEPIYFSTFYPSATAYLNAVQPFAQAIKAAVPSARVAVYIDPSADAWTLGVAAYANRFWDEVYMHQYPSPPGSATSVASQIAYFNEFLLNNSNSLIDSTFAPLFPGTFQIEMSEFNIAPLDDTLYNAVYVAEDTLRLSADPYVTNVGMHVLVGPQNALQVAIATTNDHTADCIAAYNLGQVINTSNLSFGYFLSPSALALELIDQPINTSQTAWTTTVSGGTSVAYAGGSASGTMPAIYAQAYQTYANTTHLLLTNKDSVSQQVAITVNGILVTSSLTTRSIGGTNPAATNSASAPTTIAIQNGNSTLSIALPPYSVMDVEWP